MGKFPALNFIRYILYFFAVLIVLGGFLSVLLLAQSRSWMASVIVFMGLLLSALFLVAVGEIIYVLLQIEDHLDESQRLQEKMYLSTRQDKRLQ